MNKHIILINSIMLSLLLTCNLSAQNVGIGTETPVRTLEVRTDFSQFTRIHSSNTIGGEAALELILGGPLSTSRDYKITNDAGVFRLMTGTDNFDTEGDERWRINYLGHIGLGTNLPQTRLHIATGEEASNTGNGYMIIGSKSGVNIAMDPNEILARNNSNSSSLTIQSNGGQTNISAGGGDTYIGGSSGSLGIGTANLNSKLNIANGAAQLSLRNPADGLNEWLISATNDTWGVGGNQLVFTPANSSAVLRLMGVTDNNGTVAPVMIKSAGNQTLLLDGNEIDTKDGVLYINYNSQQNTYINPSGGRVGIGTDEPPTTLQIESNDDYAALRLEYESKFWDINPVPAANFLGFDKNGWIVGHIDGTSGQWITISDKRLKENILPLDKIMDKVMQLKVYNYTFKDIPDSATQIGLLAQELKPLFPELVHEHEGLHTMAYSKLSVIILKALKEQQDEIQRLEEELLALAAMAEQD